MIYYVYIIQSQIDLTFYKGYTMHPTLRLEQHNNGESDYTSKKIPWKLVALFSFEEQSHALRFEKRLKKYGHKRLISLINSGKNDLNSDLELFSS